jgi:hypothetical protein
MQPPPDEKAARANLELLLDEFFELDFLRFKGRHARARADAGPSLMGGPRGIDRWTYGYVREHTDDCLREVSTVVVAFAGESFSEPGTGERLLRPRLRRHFEEIFELLGQDRRDGSAHEFSVLPAKEALYAAREYTDRSLGPALEAVARGQVEPRLKRRFGLFARAARFTGGSDRLILYTAVVVFVLAMWAVL